MFMLGGFFDAHLNVFFDVFKLIFISLIFDLSSPLRCAKINPRENFLFSRTRNARKFVRAKISTNKVNLTIKMTLLHPLKQKEFNFITIDCFRVTLMMNSHGYLVDHWYKYDSITSLPKI